MTIPGIKSEARHALDMALDNEGKARKRMGMTEMMEFPGGQLEDDRESLVKAVASTKAAIDAFAEECRAETRAGIVAWIAAAPARMDAQAAAGAQPLHYMHTIGQLAAAASLAEAIKNKADQEDRGS